MTYFIAYLTVAPIVWVVFTWYEVRHRAKWGIDSAWANTATAIWWTSVLWPAVPPAAILCLVLYGLFELGTVYAELREELIYRWVQHEKQRQERKRAETKDA